MTMKKYLATSLAVTILLLAPTTMSFALAPAITPSPTGAIQGSTFVVNGTNFTPGDYVNVTLGSSPQHVSTTIQVGTDGSFSTALEIALPAGTYPVTATDTSNSQQATSSYTVATPQTGEDPTVTGITLGSGGVVAPGSPITETVHVADPKVANTISGGLVEIVQLGPNGSVIRADGCTLSSNTCTVNSVAPTTSGYIPIMADYFGTAGFSPSGANSTIFVTSSTSGGSSSPTVQGQMTLVQTCGLNPSAGTLNYGNLSPGTTSTIQSLSLVNSGTTSESVMASGNDWTSQSGTPAGSIMPVSSTEWELSGGTSYTPLTASPASMVSSLGYGATQATTWELNVPTVTSDPTLGSVTSGTILQQTVTFTTSC